MPKAETHAPPKQPIAWTQETRTLRLSTFEKCKESLAQAMLLAHPESNIELNIISNSSDTTAGGVLQLLVDGQSEFLAILFMTPMTMNFCQSTQQLNASGTW